jgi:uridine kinase
MKRTSYVLAVCGGSGSGKSTLAFGLQDRFPGQVLILHIDDYFRPESEVPVLQGMASWDDPQAVYSDKMINDLAQLKAGETVTVKTKSPRLNPDFLKTGARIPVEFEPRPLIVVEGFLALHFQGLRKLYDYAIYLDVPFEVHTSRRVHGKLHNFSTEYDEKVLKPMHEQYVTPSRQYADLTLQVGAMNQQQVLEKVISMLQLDSMLGKEPHS